MRIHIFIVILGIPAGRTVASSEPGLPFFPVLGCQALLTAFPGNADLQMALFAANNPADAKVSRLHSLTCPEQSARQNLAS